ncbi:MAG: hypothetical protein OXI01_01720 [Albidovulum sp.]|nr:hypothetical protein [Albidovulum sp.]
MGLPRSFPEISPSNVKGIESNPFTAELARDSIWIGANQWMRRNEFAEIRGPILRPFDNIECRDASPFTGGSEPNWPEADIIVGNPPFLGSRKARKVLGYDCLGALSRTYRSQIAGKPDLVRYWFAKAGKLFDDGKVGRAGPVATNSIRGGTNRKVLDRIAETGVILDARADEEWTVEVAAVRVLIVCSARANCGDPVILNGSETRRIYTDLAA